MVGTKTGGEKNVDEGDTGWRGGDQQEQTRGLARADDAARTARELRCFDTLGFAGGGKRPWLGRKAPFRMHVQADLCVQDLTHLAVIKLRSGHQIHRIRLTRVRSALFPPLWESLWH